MPEVFLYSFMVQALLAGVAVGLAAPALGVFLVLRRLSLIADTLSHVALLGVAIGLLTRTFPPLVALGLSTGAAAAIEGLRSSGKLWGEAALALFLYTALALAVTLISFGQGFNVDLFGYLFGNILTVGEQDSWLIFGIATATLILIGFFYRELVQTTLDVDLARVSGVPVARVNFLLAILTGAVVTMAMRVVGVLLVGALMVLPVLASLQIARGFRMTLVLAMTFGLISSVGGLVGAYYLRLAPGGTIVLFSLAILAGVVCVKVVLRTFHRFLLRDKLPRADQS